MQRCQSYPLQIFSIHFVLQKELINNISFGFLNYSCLNDNLYFIYGMTIGLETKVIIAFENDKPLRNEDARKICQNIFDYYLKDQLNPFNEILHYKPSDRLENQIQKLVTR